MWVERHPWRLTLRCFLAPCVKFTLCKRHTDVSLSSLGLHLEFPLLPFFPVLPGFLPHWTLCSLSLWRLKIHISTCCLACSEHPFHFSQLLLIPLWQWRTEEWADTSTVCGGASAAGTSPVCSFQCAIHSFLLYVSSTPYIPAPTHESCYPVVSMFMSVSSFKLCPFMNRNHDN